MLDWKESESRLEAVDTRGELLIVRLNEHFSHLVIDLLEKCRIIDFVGQKEGFGVKLLLLLGLSAGCLLPPGFLQLAHRPSL